MKWQKRKADQLAQATRQRQQAKVSMVKEPISMPLPRLFGATSGRTASRLPEYMTTVQIDAYAAMLRAAGWRTNVVNTGRDFVDIELRVLADEAHLPVPKREEMLAWHNELVSKPVPCKRCGEDTRFLQCWCDTKLKELPDGK